MAKRKKSMGIGMPVFHEPTPKQEFEYALERVVEKALLAHPKVQKLREAITEKMTKAAGNGENGTAAKKAVQKKRG